MYRIVDQVATNINICAPLFILVVFESVVNLQICEILAQIGFLFRLQNRIQIFTFINFLESRSFRVKRSGNHEYAGTKWWISGWESKQERQVARTPTGCTNMGSGWFSSNFASQTAEFGEGAI